MPGSLTKEFPITSLDQTIQAITPGMAYDDLRQYAREHTNASIPSVLKNRFLLVLDGQVVYDEFLSLAAAEGLTAARTRKVMYFVWAYRDDRIRRFVCERIANRRGVWRPAEVVRRSNADFFEQFVRADTAPKVRSNYERFLVEAGIFDAATQAVRLDLDDDWLPDALRVAEQHEQDAKKRRAMTANPAEFLISNGWQGLANATAETLRRLPPVVAAPADPLEDLPLPAPSMHATPGRPWDRPPPTAATRRAASVRADPVALERANAAHHRLESIAPPPPRRSGANRCAINTSTSISSPPSARRSWPR
jgi:hypothetical protein